MAEFVAAVSRLSWPGALVLSVACLSVAAVIIVFLWALDRA